ncbi:four-carbon acid sugar kinase family protein [Rhodopseudomonas sp. P2A-2r]|uniref:four-carbon acid sugar kinase family protein n=1 Tax=Rhodopseudomonas sp. P2A-2r TaxID=2991972 RepID=UPI002234DFD9|nr:four-carbon acid sugar kinase family protein [Rhodopseudomonas sp. P2A-2r]UZE51282.1 four-carbon acid sugar kinase family protein [Rhodopseudomonas sp. P2A-2r]
MTGLAAPRALPDGLLLGFYGDDFTGSTSTMEVMSFAGLPTALFLDAPTPERLKRFAGYRGVGIAGIARSQTPDWMDAHLPGLFAALAALHAPVVHYKICSTLDSAPHVGSIGRAIDIAAGVFAEGWTPFVVAAPAIGRYQAFGNLFAAVAGTAHRLDRHPVMARHPVTPMDEADVRRHLARQTSRPMGLVDLVSTKQGRGDAVLAHELAQGARIVALDVVDEETLIEAGRLIWERGGRPVFAVGSQGVEYALVAYWQACGLLDKADERAVRSGVDRIACVSGSCSPVTAGQIAHACDNGFAALRIDATRAVDPDDWARAIGQAADDALAAIGRGRDPLIFTAAGPDDPGVAALGAAIATSGSASGAVNDRIGKGLGQLLDQVMRKARLRRCVVAGGDTSGHATLAMGIYALTALAPIAPGAPLCRAYADDPSCDGREIALKGGQIGAPDYFSAVKRG